MNANHTGRNILLILVSIFLLAGAFSGGLIVGWLIPSATNLETLPVPTEEPQVAPEPQPSTDTQLDKLFEPFWEAWQIVHKQFVDQPVDDLK